MSTYLGLMRLSTEEAKRLLRDGPTARREHLAHLAAEAGGRLTDAWLTNVGDWDLVCVVEMADESPVSGAAATLARRAAGLTDSERWIELADIDAVTATVNRLAVQGAV